ncbi:MAG TPA: hypothetical protein VJH95_03630 [Candidatus Nanoarchaeia archaeon]|nr:hypothetical protein [Candidatus Nanoarchaeia archaeon]
MANGMKQVMEKLESIQSNVVYIREHIDDITLTEDDLQSLRQADKEFKEGKTISHVKLKKELGL